MFGGLGVELNEGKVNLDDVIVNTLTFWPRRAVKYTHLAIS